MKELAYAKVNLTLRVFDETINGLHKIDSIVDKISLHDTLHIRRSKSMRVVCKGIPEEDNLCYKIAIYLKEKYNISDGVFIKIEKRIPVSAGLGGGSSDAATTIKCLNKLWKLNLSREDMINIGKEFGSDIPLFFYDGLLRVSGTGDQIEVIQTHLLFNYIVIPFKEGVSTKDVYNNYVYIERESNDIISAFEENNESKVYSLLFNDLALATNKIDKNIVHPMELVETVNSKINELNVMGKALITGSGPTVYVSYFNSVDKKLFVNAVLPQKIKYFDSKSIR